MEAFSQKDATSLGTYLEIVRRRAWIVVLCALVVPAVAYELSSRQPAAYATFADVYVNQQNIASILTGIGSGFSGTSTVVTQASLAGVPVVAKQALAIAGLHDRSPGALLAQTTISPNPDVSMLRFTVVDRSPVTAALLATSYARAFTIYSNQLESQPIVRARADLRAAMAKLEAAGRKDSALYTSFEVKDQQLQTVQTLQTAATTLVRKAALGGQIAPHPRRNAALGVMLGLILGLGIAFALEALDTRVRTPAELAEGLGGLPLLARIPPPKSGTQKRDGLAIVVEPKHAAAEAFRLLRANLDFMRLSAGEVRTILVTSAVEKEGKSTTAANLAVAEARSGRRVALVDLDLRRPYIDRFFRLRAVEGVTDVALGTLELSEALQRIDLHLGAPEAEAVVPSPSSATRTPVADAGVLDVLVSGPLPPDPGEFAASYRLAEILSQLRQGYDTVIIDTPPILWVGDALTLSSQADGLIVVARPKLLRKGMLRELRRILDVVPTRKLGYVVTGPVSGEGRGVYGRRHRYGYGLAYDYGKSPRAPHKVQDDAEKLGSVREPHESGGASPEREKA